MSRKRDRKPARPQETRSEPKPEPDPEQTRVERFRQRLAAMAAGAITAPLFRFYGTIFIAAAGVLLIIAWQSAPQRLLDAHRFAAYTGHTEGRIVESWLALVWRPSDMGEGHLRWHAYAKAEPCAVVEYAGPGAWGALRRAFCGNRFPFRDSDELQAFASLAPGVPFGWLRDERGFIVPEVRVSAASLQWLSVHEPYSTLFLGKPAPRTALAALDEQFNHPVDEAVASWSSALPAFPLAFDPQHPEAAMPRVFVESRLNFEPGNWLLLAFAGALGLVFWFAGMQTILGNVPPRARWILSLVPLATLPWWSEQFPDALHIVSNDLAGVVDDMVGGIDRTGRVVGADPGDATLADGERLAFRVGREPYAATFGRMKFAAPAGSAKDADAALAALISTVGAQVRALPVNEQMALFAQLTRDKKNDLRGAGLAFVPVARDIVVTAAADAGLRESARRFLSEWVVQPVVEPHPGNPDFRTRLGLYRQLSELPVPEIAIMAGSVADRAERSAEKTRPGSNQGL